MISGSLPRREFLRASVAAGGGLLLAFSWPLPLGGKRAAAAAAAAGTAAEVFAPNAFVRIATDGAVTVIINKAEMGQGVTTSLSMLLAEELDADWSRVGFEFAPADLVYAHPGFGIQMTGGSSSIFGMSEPMRRAGATARAMLVAAAAKRWVADATECRTENGVVIHPPSGRSATYGELATAAASMPAPTGVVLKEPEEFRILGRTHARLDTPEKIRGTAIFGLDVSLPGMLVAVVAHPPTFGGRAKKVRSDAARALPGVKHVVELPSGVAVVATGFWAAKQGRDLLEIDWDRGPNAGISTEGLREQYRALSRTPGLVARRDGDAAAAIGDAAKRLEADYEVPYLAHAPMEPLNCVVDLREDRMEIWAGSQFQTVDQAAAARVAGLDPSRVTLHTTFLGGGFGRRANPASDYIVEAVGIAKAVRAPVKLVWTREDDTRGGYYRPLWHSRFAAAIDKKGALAGWHHTIVGQSIIAGTPFEPFIIKDGIDGTSVEGGADLPYAIPNVQVELHSTKVGVPTLWWRSVGHSHTAFATECFLDEVAAALGKDPYEFRRGLLAAHPRHLAVLDRVAEGIGWGERRAPGRAVGIAVHASFGSWVAHAAEVSIEAGVPRVHRIVAAIDCGRVVNPDTVVAQLEGAAGFALGTALYSEITLRDGRVVESNFHDYRMLRIPEMPAVEVHIIESDAPSTGVGEPGVPTVAPAVANALFGLTGKRIRRLPFRSEDLSS